MVERNYPYRGEKIVNFRCPQAELALLQSLATADGATVSETVRRLIRQEAARRGLTVGLTGGAR